MPETDIDSAVVANAEGTFTSYEVPAISTEGAGDGNEVTWQNCNWTKDYGYYLTVPEFKTAVDAKATWTMGAGIEADIPTLVHLGQFTGNGKESFNSIIKNMIKIKTISRDSFAEIIRDNNGIAINLKPLDPGSIKVVQNKKGRIIRYEQVSKSGDTPNKKFKLENIFHLSHDRLADEIKGTRILDSLEWLILARNEAMSDWKKVLHRNVAPMFIFHLDTDDTTQINSIKTKFDQARADGENLYVPKGAVVPELVATATNSSLNPLTWIEQLNNYFFQAVMVPQIIVGNSQEFTDSSGKIAYLSFEQSVKAEQLYIEEEVLSQLNIEIKLTFPASLENELITSRNKEPTMQAATPDDGTAELEGRR